MARLPSSFLTEVVTRRKSSPVRTNTVALPPVSRLKVSTVRKSRFRTSPPAVATGPDLSPMAIERVASTRTGPGIRLSNTFASRSALIFAVPSSTLS